MRFFRIACLAVALASPLAAALVPSDAQASVSIAVAVDALVKDSDAVAVIEPVEQMSVWEDNRIYTYTKVKVTQGIAGEMPTGGEGWVRTMGGVVGKIGQLVDGEAVFVMGKPSMVFLRQFKAVGTWTVTARAQGQYPVIFDEQTKAAKIIHSASVGVLLPPRAKANVAPATPIQPQSVGAGAAATTTAKLNDVRLAHEYLHDKPLDETAREIAAAWKQLHATAPAPATK